MLKCPNFKPDSLRNGVYVTAINVSDYRYLVMVYFIDVTIGHNFDPLSPNYLKVMLKSLVMTYYDILVMKRQLKRLKS